MRRITRTLATTAATIAVAASAAAAGMASTPSTVPTTSPRCHTSELTIRDEGANGAAGSVIDGFRIKNVSGHTCHTRGFAGLTLISRLGNVLPTHVTRDGTSHRVSLRSGQTATFAISFHVVDLRHGGISCHSHTGHKLRVIPPDETDFKLVTLRGRGIKPCHGQIAEQAIMR